MDEYRRNFNTIKGMINNDQISESLTNRNHSFSTFSKAMTGSLENKIIKIGKVLKEHSVHSDMDIQDIYWVLLYLFYSDYRHINIDSVTYREKDIEKSNRLHYLIYSEGGDENISSGVTIKYTDELGLEIIDDLYKYINEKLNTSMYNRGGKSKRIKLKKKNTRIKKLNKRKTKKYKK